MTDPKVLAAAKRYLEIDATICERAERGLDCRELNAEAERLCDFCLERGFEPCSLLEGF